MNSPNPFGIHAPSFFEATWSWTLISSPCSKAARIARDGGIASVGSATGAGISTGGGRTADLRAGMEASRGSATRPWLSIMWPNGLEGLR